LSWEGSTVIAEGSDCAFAATQAQLKMRRKSKRTVFMFAIVSQINRIQKQMP
jgi:hypothetical protein